MKPYPPFLIALLLALPLVGASGGMVSTTGVDGAGLVELSAKQPILLAPGKTGGFELQAEGRVAVRWTDEWYTTTRDLEGGPPLAGFATTNRDADFRNVTSQGMHIRSLYDGEDAVLLVVPLDGGRSLLEATQRGRYGVSAVEDELLEQSHVKLYDDRDDVWISGSPPSFPYYEYRAQDTLAARISGDGTYTARGDFLLYLWSHAYAFDGGGQHRTGTWIAPDPDNSMLDRYHHAYSVVEARDAVLTVAIDGSSTVFGDAIEATVIGDTKYSGAQGSVPGQGGFYEAAGDVVVRDGTATWHSTKDGISVAFTSPATHVAGATYMPGPDKASLLAVFGFAAAILLVAGTWALPHAFSRGVRGFRAGRAEGFSRMAVTAESSGMLFTASVLSRHAVRWEPDNPVHWINRASFLGARGKTRSSLWCHERAHSMLEHTSDDASIAQNAYDAARVAARVGDESAGDWLRIALDHEPVLMDAVPKDPALARVFRGLGTPSWGDLVRP